MGDADNSEKENGLLLNNNNNNNNNNKQLLSSLDPTCNDLKHAYDACFNLWFPEKFLKGDHQGPSPCDELLKPYSECVKKALKVKKIDLEPLSEMKDFSSIDKEKEKPRGNL